MIGCIYAHACDTHVNTEPTKYDILHFQINNISDLPQVLLFHATFYDYYDDDDDDYYCCCCSPILHYLIEVLHQDINSKDSL